MGKCFESKSYPCELLVLTKLNMASTFLLFPFPVAFTFFVASNSVYLLNDSRKFNPLIGVLLGTQKTTNAAQLFFAFLYGSVTVHFVPITIVSSNEKRISLIYTFALQLRMR